MSWNYRIVKLADGSHGLYEVHYRADGKPGVRTENPAAFLGDTPEEVRSALMLAKADATRRPILDDRDIGV